MSEDGNGAGFGTGLIVGILAGASLALLYAARPGRETRVMLKEKAEEWRGRAENIIQETRGRVRKIIDDARSQASKSNTDVIP